MTESFHRFDESPSEGMVTSLVDFRRVGDVGGLGDNGGERFVETPDFTLFFSEKYQTTCK